MELKVIIDESECLGYGDCAALVPDAFEVDDVARVKGRASSEELIAAAKACPAEAITLIDTETGEQVFP